MTGKAAAAVHRRVTTAAAEKTRKAASEPIPGRFYCPFGRWANRKIDRGGSGEIDLSPLSLREAPDDRTTSNEALPLDEATDVASSVGPGREQKFNLTQYKPLERRELVVLSSAPSPFSNQGEKADRQQTKGRANEGYKARPAD